MFYCTMRALLLVFLVHLNWAETQKQSQGSARQGKVFSLFSIVQFPNDVCDTTSSSQTEGLCLASSECSAKSGSASGSCASGFGVCCLFSVSTCGSSISTNVTYITNPGFPATYSTTGDCKYTVNKCSADICQIRLDFTTLALNIVTGTDITATCFGCCGAACTETCVAATAPLTPTDSLIVAGQTGANPPTICGINTGYHMYVDAGGAGTDTVTVDFSLSSTGNRQWNVKVSQIACDSTTRAPNGCTQYFTGATGSVASYGFGSGSLLGSQQYANCVRQEKGYCSITWQESSTTSPDPFMLTNGATAAGTAESAVDLCLLSYIHIQKGEFAPGTQANQFCGEALGVTATTVPSPLTSDVLPFQLGVLTVAQAAATDKMVQAQTANTMAIGFNLDYKQNPC